MRIARVALWVPSAATLSVMALLVSGGRTAPAMGTPMAGSKVPAAALTAYQRYVELADAKFFSEVADRELFLDIHSLSGKERDEAFATVRRGSNFVRKIELRDAQGRKIKPDHALIHHWIGTAFVPGATLEQALRLAKDYDAYSEVFAPDVTASRLLGDSTSDDMNVFLRLRKKKVRTFVYDTEHSVHYVRLDPDRAYSTAVATLVREVEHPGTAREQRKDDGAGFLWRIRTYWRYSQVEGGLYLENESLMLTRSVPFLARLFIGPIIRAGTRDGVQMALSSLRRALQPNAGEALETVDVPPAATNSVTAAAVTPTGDRGGKECEPIPTR